MREMKSFLLERPNRGNFKHLFIQTKAKKMNSSPRLLEETGEKMKLKGIEIWKIPMTNEKSEIIITDAIFNHDAKECLQGKKR